jgi:hypothetical protein
VRTRILLLVLMLGQPLLGLQFPPGTTTEQREENPEQAKWRRDAAKKANQERQAQIQRDTERLLKLANELKDYVDKSNENLLSLEVVKKAEEIEKLAHDVKEKMKTSY